MHQLLVNLTNPTGLRLTVGTRTQVRTTSHENEACRRVEAEVNEDATHAAYGPWAATSSKWQG